MSGSLGRPDDGARIAALERKVAMLERRTAPASGGDFEITFSYAGALVSDTESAPKPIRRASTLTVFAVSFKTAGSTATVLEIKSAGTILDTVTIPAGVTAYRVDIMRRFIPEQPVSLRIVTAGTGATDMTANARFD